MAYRNPSDISDPVIMTDGTAEGTVKVDMTEFLSKDNIPWRIGILARAYDIPRDMFDNWFNRAERYWHDKADSEATMSAWEMFYLVNDNHQRFQTEVYPTMGEPLREASLNKIGSHLENHEPMIFISSEQGNLSDEDNNLCYDKLKALADSFVLDNKDADYTKVKGSIDLESNTATSEHTIMMHGTRSLESSMLEWAEATGAVFKQKTILYIDSQGEAFYVAPEGCREPLGAFTTQVIPNFFSTLNDASLDESSRREKLYYIGMAEKAIH